MATKVCITWDPNEKWDVNLEALLPNVDIFLPNEAELIQMTGTSSVREGMNKILPFCNHVVVKKGVQGAVLYTEGMQIQEPALLNEGMVDAIGAGDSFNAGFIHAFLLQQPLTVCLGTGIVTGAINTTAAGGTGAFVSMEEVSRLALEKYDFKLKGKLREEKV